MQILLFPIFADFSKDSVLWKELGVIITFSLKTALQKSLICSREVARQNRIR